MLHKNSIKLTTSQKIVLQQLNYWLSQKNSRYGLIRDGKQWIRNSYAAWQKQIGSFSVITIRRSFTELEKLGLVESKNFAEGKNFSGGEQVKYFTINFDRLNELLNTSKPLKNKAFSPINFNTKVIGGGDQNDHPYISNKTSNLKKYHKKNLINSKSQPTQQDGNFKNIFDSDQIQNIFSMKQIWNSVIEGKGDDVLFEDLSKHEQAFLLQALNQYFNNDLNQWKSFCTKITTSSFLMGEKTSFKVSLSWVLKFANLQKILEGSLYGFGDRIPQPFKTLQIKDESPITCDLQQDVMMDGFVQESLRKQALDLRHKILERVGEGAYNSWFAKARLVLKANNQYILCVENVFLRNSVKNRFEFDLKGLIEDVCLIGEVNLVISKEEETKIEETDTPMENVLESSETHNFSEESPQEGLIKSEEYIGSSVLDEVFFVDTSLNDQHITLDASQTPIICDLQKDIKMDGFVQESLRKQALDLRHNILERVGERVHNSWFSNNQYILCVENTFIKNSFEFDLKVPIDDILRNSNINNDIVRFLE